MESQVCPIDSERGWHDTTGLLCTTGWKKAAVGPMSLVGDGDTERRPGVSLPVSLSSLDVRRLREADVDFLN